MMTRGQEFEIRLVKLRLQYLAPGFLYTYIHQLKVKGTINKVQKYLLIYNQHRVTIVTESVSFLHGLFVRRHRLFVSAESRYHE